MSAVIAHTDLKTINSTLLSHNPFAKPPVVNTSDIWNQTFYDIESLNSHASNAVFEALRQIKDGQYSTTSILVTAEQGTGKSHLISRIRRRLWQQGGVLFILANKFDDLNDIKGDFQRILSGSLSNVGSGGIQQWQEIAESIANSAIKNKDPNSSNVSAQELTKRLEEAEESEARKLIKGWVKSFCKKRPVQDRDIVKAILWTLSEEEGSDARKWLAGKEIAQYKANELLLPSQNKSFDAVIDILDIISDYSEIIICIDEIDVGNSHSDAGLHMSLIVASLVKELLQNLKKGIILSVMIPDTWSKRIKQLLPAGISEKITTHGTPLKLEYMNGESILELVRCSMTEYAESNSIVLPSPTYPFDEKVLLDLGRDKPTVRRVWKWCRENCKPLEESEISTVGLPASVEENPNKRKPNLGKSGETSDLVIEAFSSEMKEAEQTDVENSQVLAGALRFSLQKLEGQKVDNVEIYQIEEKVKKGKKKDPYLNFKILGKEQGDDICIGVALLQHDGGQALGAGFKRLLDEKGTFGLTRGCLVRSQQKTISGYIKNKYLKPLIDKGGEFVALKPEEIYPLLAIHSVFRKRESDYDVTEEQISEFILSHGQEKLLGEHNPLLREILSDPSHEIPDLVEEPEAEVIVPETDDDDDDV